ncbi:alpha/beta hydrolase [Hymenobacter taeanensis]|uniref:Alpha/beta hydrolase n=1 Tax=Hymenobacter taeanensis TaxID=2735321 RepID=A0A6M6BHC2_9BACT|nr:MULTISPECIES: alpha/beta hydrolase [Hymenobacter]QJX47440.1 alpha/beta hydrolase [Hymenobacter taeanensis]UOQ83078.1 alpha/beta hydrolase [Hymenobacter sp. 5414T-23]
MQQPAILIVPGLGNSGPEHWQTHWEHHYGYLRVQQHDWDCPIQADWVQTLEDAIAAAGPDVVLVGHSLGCITIAHWAGTTQHRIKGALLVAPADVDRSDMPPEVVNFAPIPLARLPFPSIVVASTTDEYMTLERAQQLAQAWGSRFVNVGALGHINSESGLGLWPEGHALLQDLVG